MITIPKVATNFDYPPIPIRCWDWSAWYEDEEDEQMSIGRGQTEAEAILDLIENYDPIPRAGYGWWWNE